MIGELSNLISVRVHYRYLKRFGVVLFLLDFSNNFSCMKKVVTLCFVFELQFLMENRFFSLQVAYNKCQATCDFFYYLLMFHGNFYYTLANEPCSLIKLIPFIQLQQQLLQAHNRPTELVDKKILVSCVFSSLDHCTIILLFFSWLESNLFQHIF